MINKPTISVIVPIYKTGTILEKTLKSIQKQTFTEFECLMIDDGSYDKKTHTICNDFVLNDSRFKYFQKENDGIEKTRLYGVDKSISSLIAFCDHDDYYDKNALQFMYKAWLNSRADIVIGNCYSQLLRKVPFRKGHYLHISKEVILNRHSFINQYYKNFFGINVFPVSTWGKLYSKHLFNERLECFGYNFFEDTVLNAQLFSRINKVHFIPEFLYTHIYGGLSSRFDVKSVLSGYSDIYQFRKDLLKLTGLYEKLNKYVLIEFKNVVNQNAALMIENGYDKEEFISAMKLVEKSDILKDTLVSEFDKGKLFEFICTGNYSELYDYMKKNYNYNSYINTKAKKIFKSFIS